MPRHSIPLLLLRFRRCSFVTASSFSLRVVRGNPWLLAAVTGNMAFQVSMPQHFRRQRQKQVQHEHNRVLNARCLQVFLIYTPEVNSIWGAWRGARAATGRVR